MIAVESAVRKPGESGGGMTRKTANEATHPRFSIGEDLLAVGCSNFMEAKKSSMTFSTHEAQTC